MKSLVIVESPAKVKTIKKYLGEGYEVASSKGHIRDLPKKEMGIDIEHGFTPKYVISSDHVSVVADLKKKAKEADVIYLAGDDDREGEAISWHIKEALELTDEKVRRIVFHEITEKAIKNAIVTPRQIDTNLVNSQQARRVLDRLVGYELSPILWKKVKRGLSAGRVQSVAVKMVVEREREIKNFIPVRSFKVIAQFMNAGNSVLHAELKKSPERQDDVISILESIKDTIFNVTNIEKKSTKRTPPAPFTTSTLQQEASQALGYSVTRTMVIAQKLYEAGRISYMRTDSVVLSEDAIEQARKVISNDFGDDYVNAKQYKNKSKLTQGGHEAIRPTNFEVIEASSDAAEQKLYSLIRRRAIASQMADAEVDKTVVTIDSSSTRKDITFVARGSVIRFDGFLKLYHSHNDEDDNDKILPDVAKGDQLSIKIAIAKEKVSRGPSHYSEASLVKELEERGIGRPSTYATIIGVIQQRGYVILSTREGVKKSFVVIKLTNGEVTVSEEQDTCGGEKNKLFPADIAMITNDFLEKSFSKIMDYNFTADVEKQLDSIADGGKSWTSMISDFYKDFSVDIHACRDVGHVIFEDRLLGVDPTTGKNVYARVTSYGPAIQYGDKTDTEKPKYVSLLKSQNVESITLDEAIKLSEFPKTIGIYDGKPVMVNIGTYGPYVKYDCISAGVYDGINPFTITLDEAIDVIKRKNEYIAKKKATKR